MMCPLIEISMTFYRIILCLNYLHKTEKKKKTLVNKKVKILPNPIKWNKEKVVSSNAFNLDKYKIPSFGNELILYKTTIL